MTEQFDAKREADKLFDMAAPAYKDLEALGKKLHDEVCNLKPEQLEKTANEFLKNYADVSIERDHSGRISAFTFRGNYHYLQLLTDGIPCNGTEAKR